MLCKFRKANSNWKIPVYLLLLMLFNHAKTNAQQEFNNGFYMFNPLGFNPAVVGSNDVMESAIQVREQWTGLNGAPRTQYFNFHTPIYQLVNKFDEYDNLGEFNFPTGISAGICIRNDEIGALQKSTIGIPIGYRVRLNDKGIRLAAGIQTEIVRMSFDYEKLRALEPNDPLIHPTDPAIFTDYSVGLYLYHTRWNIGLSGTSLREKNLMQEYAYELVRHYHASGAYSFPLSESISTRLSALANVVWGVPLSFTVSPSISIRNNMEVGLSYRFTDMFGAFLSIKPLKRFRVGYWFEYPIGFKQGTIGNTHEFMIQYTFRRKENSNRVPSSTYE